MLSYPTSALSGIFTELYITLDSKRKRFWCLGARNVVVSVIKLSLKGIAWMNMLPKLKTFEYSGVKVGLRRDKDGRRWILIDFSVLLSLITSMAQWLVKASSALGVRAPGWARICTQVFLLRTLSIWSLEVGGLVYQCLGKDIRRLPYAWSLYWRVTHTVVRYKYCNKGIRNALVFAHTLSLTLSLSRREPLLMC